MMAISAERHKLSSGTFSGRFGSDLGAPPSCISDFWPLSQIFGLLQYLRFSQGDPNHSAEYQPRIIAQVFYSTMAPKMFLHTHTFYCLGINFPITQDICYTRLSRRNALCNLAPS